MCRRCTSTWPPVLPGVLFRYDNRSGRQHWSSQSWEVPSWLKFYFTGMPAVKLCDGSGCQRRTFSFVREVARVVPAATSQIHRLHIRARLYWENKLIVRFADDFVRSSFHCIFKKLSLKVFIQKKTFERCWTASGQSGTFKVIVSPL